MSITVFTGKHDNVVKYFKVTYIPNPMHRFYFLIHPRIYVLFNLNAMVQAQYTYYNVCNTDRLNGYTHYYKAK